MSAIVGANSKPGVTPTGTPGNTDDAISAPQGSSLGKVAAMQEANQLVFTNRVADAEALLLGEMGKTSADGPDLRGACGVLLAFISASSGIGSLNHAHFMDCLSKFRAASKLAKHDKDSVGKKAVKGLCLLSIGLIELVEHMFLKVSFASNFIREFANGEPEGRLQYHVRVEVHQSLEDRRYTLHGERRASCTICLALCRGVILHRILFPAANNIKGILYSASLVQMKMMLCKGCELP